MGIPIIRSIIIYLGLYRGPLISGVWELDVQVFAELEAHA